jgi:AICAR transformylase/IMP cyclohydrolase PurH
MECYRKDKVMDIGYKKDGKFYKLVVGKSKDKDLPDVYFVQLYAFNEKFTKREMLVNAVVDSVDILGEENDRG